MATLLHCNTLADHLYDGNNSSLHWSATEVSYCLTVIYIYKVQSGISVPYDIRSTKPQRTSRSIQNRQSENKEITLRWLWNHGKWGNKENIWRYTACYVEYVTEWWVAIICNYSIMSFAIWCYRMYSVSTSFVFSGLVYWQSCGNNIVHVDMNESRTE